MHIVGIGVAVFAALWLWSWTERRRQRKAAAIQQKAVARALHNLNPGRLNPAA
jgi:uncharacterized protein (DUF2141 family)